jgi:hypothetical protein
MAKTMKMLIFSIKNFIFFLHSLIVIRNRSDYFKNFLAFNLFIIIQALISVCQ